MRLPAGAGQSWCERDRVIPAPVAERIWAHAARDDVPTGASGFTNFEIRAQNPHAKAMGVLCCG